MNKVWTRAAGCALIYISIAGLNLTGTLLSNRGTAFNGLFRIGSPYANALALKHLLVLVMIGTALYRSLLLGRRRGPSTSTRERMNWASWSC